MTDDRAHRHPAHLRLLGAFALSTSDGAQVELPSRRMRALLAILALSGEGGVSRERLAGLLWSDRADAQARASLRQCLFELRAALNGADLDVLKINRDRVALLPERLEVDASALERSLAAAPSDIQQVSQWLRSGMLLPDLEIGGLFQDWLDETRARFETVVANGVQGLLDRLTREQAWDRVLEFADAGLARDPLNEAVAASAIRAEQRLGRRVAAQRRFEALKIALARDLGVAPSAGVTAALAEGPSPTTPPAPRAGDKARLAVLAFDNLTGNPDLDYFTDGLSEEILQRVARSAELQVIARSSSFRFRGADKVIGKVAADLGATHVLDGSVRQDGARVRVSIQLADAASQDAIWTERFDRPFADSFTLQDEIAEAVASALSFALAPGPTSAAVDPVAYELYLRARNLDVQLYAGEQCIAWLEEAVRRAPGFAPAWAALSHSRVAQARHGPRPAPFPVLKAAALNAAETALSLDPNNGVVYAALARLQPFGAYAERERLLRSAVSRAPNDAVALALLGAFYNHVGRIDLALEHLRRAYALDPLYPLTADIYGATLAAAKHPDAPALYAAWRERWPQHLTFSLGDMNSLMFQNRWEKFDALVTIAEHAAGPDNPALAGTLSLARAIRAGDPDLRTRIVRRLGRTVDETGVLPLHTLATAAGLGYVEECFEIINHARFDGMFDETADAPAGMYNPGIIFDRTFFAPLMRDRRFVGLCEKLGLCRYWLENDQWPDCAKFLAPYYDFKGEVRAVLAVA
jgi:adenylate cyclase